MKKQAITKDDLCRRVVVNTTIHIRNDDYDDFWAEDTCSAGGPAYWKYELKDYEGKIVHFDSDPNWETCVVEFDKEHKIFWDCHGKAKPKHGYWIKKEDISFKH